MASQLGSVAHLAFIRHVECADHGEMVEVRDDGGPTTASRDTSTTELRQDGAQSHGHDHCVIAMLRRERTQTSPAPATVGSLQPSDLGTSLVRAIAPPPSIDILDLAPKNSPPAV